MSQLTVLNFVEGDTKPPLIGCIPDTDISEYAIALHIKYTTPLVKSATIDNAADGEFSFQWISTDLVAGRYSAEIQVTDADGKIETFQNILFVIKDQIA
jgi:hypothetical protein